MVTYPSISQPQCSKASGLLSTIPIGELHIDDLLEGGGSRFLIPKSDGANVNKAATKMPTSELQNHRELLVVTILYAAHDLNNCAVWGLGGFPFGSLLRPAHVLGPGT